MLHEASRPQRAIGYLRVSTAEQVESGLGLQAQLDAISQGAHQRGWQLVDVYRDEGQSARDLNRPALTDALAVLARGEADALIVAKLDRLSRSAIDFLSLLEWADAAGVWLVALDMALDTSTPNGRLVAAIMSSVGDWERQMIALRTREAAAVRRAEGGQMGRPSVREVAPEVAKRIEAERAAGATWQRIADGLNEESIPTVRGGLLWRVSSVQCAAGYVRPPRRRTPTALPPTVRRRSPAGRSGPVGLLRTTAMVGP
jgi:DNA invertase Pin-like site-specific DNA recombinase